MDDPRAEQSDPAIADVPRRVREAAPLVQCLTNFVSMDLVANLLSAAGASPAMVHDEHEAAEMAGLASAVVVNIGTPSDPWVRGFEAAAAAARDGGTPWVLDPVAVGATAYRRRTVAGLLALGPTVVRGNASEILALASERSAGRGVDSTDDSTAVVDQARALASATGAVVVVSGAVDVVTDGRRVTRVTGGDPVMPRVSALGCAASALVGACCAVERDPHVAAVAAMAWLAAAGGRAGSLAQGPGSLRVHLLDAVAALADDAGSGASDPVEVVWA